MGIRRDGTHHTYQAQRVRMLMPERKELFVPSTLFSTSFLTPLFLFPLAPAVLARRTRGHSISGSTLACRYNFAPLASRREAGF